MPVIVGGLREAAAAMVAYEGGGGPLAGAVDALLTRPVRTFAGVVECRPMPRAGIVFLPEGAPAGAADELREALGEFGTGHLARGCVSWHGESANEARQVRVVRDNSGATNEDHPALALEDDDGPAMTWYVIKNTPDDIPQADLLQSLAILVRPAAPRADPQPVFALWSDMCAARVVECRQLAAYVDEVTRRLDFSTNTPIYNPFSTSLADVPDVSPACARCRGSAHTSDTAYVLQHASGSAALPRFGGDSAAPGAVWCGQCWADAPPVVRDLAPAKPVRVADRWEPTHSAAARGLIADIRGRKITYVGPMPGGGGWAPVKDSVTLILGGSPPMYVHIEATDVLSLTEPFFRRLLANRDARSPQAEIVVVLTKKQTQHRRD